MRDNIGKIEVSLSPQAQKEFAELLENPSVCGLAGRYLRELDDFPPEKWGDIHEKEGKGYFKSDNHVIFDIQGKITYDKQHRIQAVEIDRFRLRPKPQKAS